MGVRSYQEEGAELSLLALCVDCRVFPGRYPLSPAHAAEANAAFVDPAVWDEYRGCRGLPAIGRGGAAPASHEPERNSK